MYFLSFYITNQKIYDEFILNLFYGYICDWCHCPLSFDLFSVGLEEFWALA